MSVKTKWKDLPPISQSALILLIQGCEESILKIGPSLTNSMKNTFHLEDSNIQALHG